MIREVRHLMGVARRSVDERGIVKTLKQGPRYLLNYISVQRAWREVEEQDTFDKTWGTDTTQPLWTQDFTSTSKNLRHAVYYRATPSDLLAPILGRLSIRHEDFVFLDFGSGKGRTVLQALEFPFKKVIGVELEPRLHAIAERNVRIYRSRTQKCKDFELVCADAAVYPLPAVNTIFYLCDPFKLPVMNAVVTNIVQSLARDRRKVFIIYVHPTHSSAITRYGLFERICESADTASDIPSATRLSLLWHVYTNRV